MNILQQEDIIKGLPDQRLQEEAKQPSGQVPQFLVVSEIQRRTNMRNSHQASSQQPQNTIADQITEEGIASIRPQQPPQGQPQPMQAYGGGMTPFMRKYAGGGVVRMQDGGITPHDMAQIDAEMMAQKYPFLSGSRDEILQGLSQIDESDYSYISSMFNGAPEIEGVLSQLKEMAGTTQNLSRGVPESPMPVENVTPQGILALNGSNTTTPDGAMGTLEGETGSNDLYSQNYLPQNMNALTEDASRIDNLLATLDDSTDAEKDAVQNPTSINLPRVFGDVDNASPKSLTSTGPTQREEEQGIGSFMASSDFQVPQKTDGGDFGLSMPSPFSDGDQAVASREFNWSRGNTDLLNRGMGGGDESGRGTSMVGASAEKILDLVGRGTVLKEPQDGPYIDPALSGIRGPLTGTGQYGGSNVSNSQASVAPKKINNTGAGQISETAQLRRAEKGASLLSKMLGLGLEGEKKQAYAMALMALGKGIADGDTAGGMLEAGKAANAITEQAADRRDKALDRKVQSQYYADKKLDANAAAEAQAFYRLETFMEKYRKEKGMIDSPEEQVQYENRLRASLGLPSIELNSGESIGATGGNQSSTANGTDPLGLFST